MACDILSTKGAVFALWGVPTVEDMDRVAQAIREAARQAGEPVLYVTRVPVGQPPPSAPVRRHLEALLPEIEPLFSSYHVVMEGGGFNAAMKRAVLLGLFQLSRRRRTFFVHSHVSEIASHIEPRRLPAFQHMVAIAGARGLLQAEGPLPRRPTQSMPPLL